jgi:hypothetical protein
MLSWHSRRGHAVLFRRVVVASFSFQAPYKQKVLSPYFLLSMLIATFPFEEKHYRVSYWRSAVAEILNIIATSRIC